jgi:hypothetical protein
MKKKYERPFIEVENVQLTQQIASCGVKIHLTDASCGLKSPYATDDMIRLALTGFFMDGCSMGMEGMDETDGICYQTNINLAFSS